MNINDISNRTILRILSLITLFVGVIYVSAIIQRQLMWVVIALFFAVALNPAVEFLRKYMPKKSRGTAAALVVFGSMALILAGIALVLPSLVSQTAALITNIPNTIRDLSTSSSPFAHMLQRYHAVDYVQKNQDKIVSSLSNFGQPLWSALKSTLGSFIAIITILSLTFFMLAEGADWLETLRRSRYGDHFRKIEPVTTDMYTAVSGYVIGNLATSLLAGVTSLIIMLILGVPYAVPLSILVGVFDLIPLVGATIAATIVLLVCLFQSMATTIIMLIFFLVYQQVENQILQPLVYSKTVQISPLIVFVAALLGASLAGIIGALFAIPVAASLKIILSYYLSTTRPKPKTPWYKRSPKATK